MCATRDPVIAVPPGVGRARARAQDDVKFDGGHDPTLFVWGGCQSCHLDARNALRKRLFRAYPSKCAGGEMLKFMCPFPSDLVQQVLNDCLANFKEARVRVGRWEKYVFDTADTGSLVLAGLFGEVPIPTRKRKGYEIFVESVDELAYCKEDGMIRLLCVLGQEVSDEIQS